MAAPTATLPDIPYVCYHRHSCVSNILLTDSVATNEDYARRAVELGHSVLSSCEHGNQGNYWQCASLADQYGLRWRYVTEAYFVKDRHEKDNTNCHIILAAKTRKGIGDLNFILSEANISGYYYRPRIDLELLLSLDPKDVFVTTACIAGVFKYGEEEATHLMGYSTPATLKKVYQHTMAGKRAEVNSMINSHMNEMFTTGQSTSEKRESA